MGKLNKFLLRCCVLVCVLVSSILIGSATFGFASPARAITERQAIFAGGCFWCMEHPFDDLEGVISTTSGYTGGTVKNPTYKQVSLGGTGHVEAVQVTYDADVVSYADLLTTYWQNVDPIDGKGQFCDKGSQYQSAIFYADGTQQQLADQSKAAIEQRFSSPIATQILPAQPFYPAEDYHQDYYLKNPVRYRIYRFGCGRDQRLAEVWGMDREVDNGTVLQKYFGEMDREEQQMPDDDQAFLDEE